MVLHLTLSSYITESFPIRAWHSTSRNPSRSRLTVHAASDVLTCAEPAANAAAEQPAPVAPPQRSLWVSPQAVTKKLANIWCSLLTTHRALQMQSWQQLRRLGLQLAWAPSDPDMDAQLDQDSLGPATMADISAQMARFLRPASLSVVQRARMLADLSNMAYDSTQVTPQLLADRYNLIYITSSEVFQPHMSAPACHFAAEALAEIESLSAAIEAAHTHARTPRGAAAELQTANNIVAAPPGWREARQFSAQHATASLASTDGGCSGGVAMAAVPPPQPRPAAVRRNSARSSQVALAVPTAQQKAAAAAAAAATAKRAVDDDEEDEIAHEPVIAAAATTAALDAAARPVTAASAAAAAASAAYPAGWFVADDAASRTRYFVIQGSITVEHWRINLQFDPVPFEGADSGVTVHKGIYEAALRLYDAFLPLVKSHLACASDCKVCFTGHSLGGSLATVLMLLFVKRGVLPASAVAPVVTFGAPAVFCEGAAGIFATGGDAADCTACHLAASGCSSVRGSCGGAGTEGCSSPGRQELQEQTSQVLEAMAVAADAAGEGTVLRSCASVDGSMSVLYGGLVSMMSMDGSSDDEWEPSKWGRRRATAPGALPSSPATASKSLATAASCGLLAALGLPPNSIHNIIMHRDIVPRAFVCDYSSVAEILKSLRPSFQAHAGLARPSHKVLYNFVGGVAVLQPSADLDFVLPDERHEMLPAAANLYNLEEVDCAAAGPGEDPRACLDRPRVTLGEVVLGFMNSPHPLHTLSEPRAYGHTGSISRFHNPDNYTKALSGLLR